MSGAEVYININEEIQIALIKTVQEYKAPTHKITR